MSERLLLTALFGGFLVLAAASDFEGCFPFAMDDWGRSMPHMSQARYCGGLK